MLRCVTCFPHKLNHLLAGILASISVKGGRLWVTTATWVKLMLSAGLEPGLELVIMAITLGVVSPSHWTFLFGLFHVSFHLAKWLIVCFTLLKCGINYIFANLCCRLTYIWIVGNMFNPKNKQAHQSDCSKLCICIPAFMDLICHWDSPNQLSVKPSVQIEDHRGGAVTPLFFNYIICIMKRTPEIGERARTENCNQIITGNWTWWGDVISAENEKLGKTQA